MDKRGVRSRRDLPEIFSSGEMVSIIVDSLETLKNQAAALKAAKFNESTRKIRCPKCANEFEASFFQFDTIAKSMAYVAKVIDEMTRLMSFVGGGPDFRAELSLGPLLSILTEEQLAFVESWIGERKVKEDIEI